jgi:hypothetical protein
LLARPAPASVGEKWAHDCLLSVGIGNQGVKKRFAGHALGSVSAQSAQSRQHRPRSLASDQTSAMQLRNDRLEPLCQQAAILGTPVRAIVCPSAAAIAIREGRSRSPLHSPIDAAIVGYLGMAWRGLSG